MKGGFGYESSTDDEHDACCQFVACRLRSVDFVRSPWRTWMVGPRVANVDVHRQLVSHRHQGGDQLGNLSHTWSLAIEEHFYLVWPLALGGRSLEKTTSRRGHAACCGTLVASADAFVSNMGTGLLRDRYQAFVLLTGCFVSVASSRLPRLDRRLGPALVFALVALSVIPDSPTFPVLVTYSGSLSLD